MGLISRIKQVLLPKVYLIESSPIPLKVGDRVSFIVPVLHRHPITKINTDPIMNSILNGRLEAEIVRVKSNNVLLSDGFNIWVLKKNNENWVVIDGWNEYDGADPTDPYTPGRT